MHRDLITLIHQPGTTDHFRGVDEALRSRGVGVERAEEPGDRSALVVLSDCVGLPARSALADARRRGVPTLLVMDGVLDFRNTFHNPRVGPAFLRPAPVDVVACAGECDRARLEWLGNRAVATGLPRLDARRAVSPSVARRILIATALTPAFSRPEWDALVEALARLKHRLSDLGVNADWRLTAGLAEAIGVEVDTRSLRESLVQTAAVISTPSTLLLEAMLVGRPTALLHATDAPCWSSAAWNLGADSDPAEITSLLQPDPRRVAIQESLLDQQCARSPDPAESLAELCVRSAAMRPRPDVRVPSMARIPARTPAIPGAPRVVSMVSCEGSPVGGVTTWSQRLGRASAATGFDVHTLLVVRNPDDWTGRDEIEWVDERTHVCSLDPMDSPVARLRTLRSALEALEPEILLPNYLDACYAAATQLRVQGVRTVAIAHTDSEYYRELIATYANFDAAVGVSDQVLEWLRPLAGSRRCEQIVYGVPVAARPRKSSADGRLRLAYVGRMTEEQKRISDLLPLFEGLHRRGVDYEFHVIGDGDGMQRWLDKLQQADLPRDRVVVHGKKSSRWVERFLPSVDVSVLVSEYEGTSITMLEAMGQGVVPAVTRVASGVSQWVEEGVTGVTAPVGEPDALAERIAWLASDRARLAEIGRRAWERARSQSVEAMARRYAEVFKHALSLRPGPTRSDLGLRLIEPHWMDHPSSVTAQDVSWVRRLLAEEGFGEVATGRPTAACDAAVVGQSASDEFVNAMRADELAVVRLPYLLDRLDAMPANALWRALQPALRDGSRRIAVYGAGRHTRRARGLFDGQLPIVGFIDDGARDRDRLFGLPVIPLTRAESELAPDAILLSSDAFEAEMAARCRPLEERGVRVIRLYTEPALADAG